MHSEIQTAAVTIISYKPLSDLNFARYTGQYGSCISPWYQRKRKWAIPFNDDTFLLRNNLGILILQT